MTRLGSTLVVQTVTCVLVLLLCCEQLPSVVGQTPGVVKVVQKANPLGAPNVWQLRGNVPSSGLWRVSIGFRKKQTLLLEGTAIVTVADLEGSPQVTVDLDARQAGRNNFKARVGDFLLVRGGGDIILSGTDQRPEFTLRRIGDLVPNNNNNNNNGQGGNGQTTEAPVVNPSGPALVCPQDVMVNTLPGQSSATARWTRPSIDGDETSVGITVSRAQGSTFPVGVTEVFVIATALDGTSNTCIFFVRVQDVEPPTLDCPQDIKRNTNNARGSRVRVSWDPPAVTDNVDALEDIQVNVTHQPGDLFPIGRTIVVYSVSDSSKNEKVCFFSVFVTDNTPPLISCPSNVVAQADFGETTGRTAWQRPTASDNSGLPVILFSSFEPGPQTAAVGLTSFPFGVTEVEYQATDIAGNVATCSFSIIVIDREAPALVCPDNVIAQPGEPIEFDDPVVSDNFPLDQLTITGSRQSGDVFPLGITSVEFVAMDSAGNRDSCTFSVNVIDDVAPELQCPESVVLGSGGTSAEVSWEEPVVTENSAAVPLIEQTANSGDSFEFGTTTVTYTATDPSGNSGSCSFTITVVDTEPPQLTCPEDMTVNTDPGSAQARVTLDQAQASDNAGDEGIVLTVSRRQRSVFGLGSTEVIVTATDVTGNQASCSFNVIIIDTEPPELTCPATVVVPTTSRENTGVPTWEDAAVSDNAGPVARLEASAVSGQAEFPVGTTMVTFTAEDASGNSASCSFAVTVVDAEAPRLTCPTDFSVDAAPGSRRARVALPDVVAQDNLGRRNVNVEVSRRSPASLLIGIRTIQVVATDEAGNQASCSYRITVLDAEAPSFTFCPADVVANKTLGKEILVGVATWDEPTARDNSGQAVSLTQTRTSGENFPLGDTVVTYTAEDRAGNVAQCEFTVTIQIGFVRISGQVRLARTLAPMEAQVIAVERLPPPTAELRECNVASVLCEKPCAPVPQCDCPQDLVQQIFPDENGCPKCRCGCPEVFERCVCGLGLDPSYFLADSQCLGCRCGPFCLPPNCKRCADGRAPVQSIDSFGCRRCQCRVRDFRRDTLSGADQEFARRQRRMVETQGNGLYELLVPADPDDFSVVFTTAEGKEVEVDVQINGVDLLIDAAVPEIQDPDEWQIITTWVRDDLPSHNDFNSMLGTDLDECPLLYFGVDACFDVEDRFLFLNENFQNSVGDADTETGAGPETISIIGPSEVYQHIVYGYEQVSSFGGSQAQVGVYNADGLIAKLHVSIDAGDDSVAASNARIWHTFAIDTRRGVTVVNQLRDDLPPLVRPNNDDWANN